MDSTSIRIQPMDRSDYKIFTEGVIAGLTVPNRLIRSATWDPSILGSRQMTEDVLNLYRNLAIGGVGLIITGGFPVYRECFPEEETDKSVHLYVDLRINGLEKMARVVRQSRPNCKIVAQLEIGYLESGPSPIPTSFSNKPVRALSVDEIEQIVACFVTAITDMQDAGFDGIQLHAAHGGLLSRFLSPYTNQRQDSFGGTPEKRSNIVREIVAGARKHVGNFPYELACAWEGGIGRVMYRPLAERKAFMDRYMEQVMGGYTRENTLGSAWLDRMPLFLRLIQMQELMHYAQYLDEPDAVNF
jgi:2,4-dienoyl-CoA reductase-like NADH-dependent reductase (Old Yellow Enzyme family)